MSLHGVWGFRGQKIRVALRVRRDPRFGGLRWAEAAAAFSELSTLSNRTFERSKETSLGKHSEQPFQKFEKIV